jgi:hypothetical protein
MARADGALAEQATPFEDVMVISVLLDIVGGLQ